MVCDAYFGPMLEYILLKRVMTCLFMRHQFSSAFIIDLHGQLLFHYQQDRWMISFHAVCSFSSMLFAILHVILKSHYSCRFEMWLLYLSHIQLTTWDFVRFVFLSLTIPQCLHYSSHLIWQIVNFFHSASHIVFHSRFNKMKSMLTVIDAILFH
jgi:hypothetical protein